MKVKELKKNFQKARIIDYKSLSNSKTVKWLATGKIITHFENQTRSENGFSSTTKSALQAAVIPAFSKPFLMSSGLSFK